MFHRAQTYLAASWAVCMSRVTSQDYSSLPVFPGYKERFRDSRPNPKPRSPSHLFHSLIAQTPLVEYVLHELSRWTARDLNVLWEPSKHPVAPIWQGEHTEDSFCIEVTANAVRVFKGFFDSDIHQVKLDHIVIVRSARRRIFVGDICLLANLRGFLTLTASHVWDMSDLQLNVTHRRLRYTWLPLRRRLQR